MLKKNQDFLIVMFVKDMNIFVLVVTKISLNFFDLTKLKKIKLKKVSEPLNGKKSKCIIKIVQRKKKHILHLKLHLLTF